MSLHVPSVNEATLSAAAALTTRIAIAAGHPFDLTIERTMPDETTGNAIIVAKLDAICPQVSQRLPGVSDTALRTAWRVPTHNTEFVFDA